MSNETLPKVLMESHRRTVERAIDAVVHPVGMHVGNLAHIPVDILQRMLNGIDILETESTRLREQLPEGMKHCTILFKECTKGHGWLTATNWIQHECPTCEQARLREELELIRAALTGDDYASLPSDLPTVRMAHTVRADHDKFRNQVRDTCHRAEQAEARALAAENALEVIAGIRKCDDRSIRSNADYAMRVLQKRDAATGAKHD